MKLIYDYVRDMILTAEVLRKDCEEFFGMSMVLSVDD